MKKDYTDITVVIDRSGSMSHLRGDVIGGFNSFIEDQKKVEGECTVTLIQFDDKYEVNYLCVPINDVKDLNYDTYSPRGTTAMYDAIGTAIVTTGVRLASMNEEDRPEKVIFIIQTDGYENASVEYSSEQIKKMIETQENEFSWEFVFLGANIDAKATAVDIGIKVDKAMTFAATSKGMNKGFASVSSNMTSFRNGSRTNMDYMESDYASQAQEGIEQ